MEEGKRIPIAFTKDADARIVVSALQPSNIYCISVTEPVFHSDKSRLVSPLQ